MHQEANNWVTEEQLTYISLAQHELYNMTIAVFHLKITECMNST